MVMAIIYIRVYFEYEEGLRHNTQQQNIERDFINLGCKCEWNEPYKSLVGVSGCVRDLYVSCRDEEHNSKIEEYVEQSEHCELY